MAVFYRHFSSHTRYQVNQPRVLINTKIKLKGKEGPSYCYAGPNSGGDLPYLLSHKASCYDFLLLKKHRLVCDLSKVITDASIPFSPQAPGVLCKLSSAVFGLTIKSTIVGLKLQTLSSYYLER